MQLIYLEGSETGTGRLASPVHWLTSHAPYKPGMDQVEDRKKPETHSEALVWYG